MVCDPGWTAEALGNILKNAAPNSVGVGLAMSRAILRAQKGDIEAENRVGTLFSLKFYDESLDGLQSVHHIV